MRYFDAHCHIQFEPYETDRREVMAHMAEQGVGGIVVGTDRDSSEKAIALVQGESDLYAAVGLHPNDVHLEEFDMQTFRALGVDPKVVAIGECGLDYFRPEEPEEAKRLQHELLEKHVELAVELNKPLMLHVRPSKGTVDAYRDLLDLLKSKKREYGELLRGDVHFFVGGVEEARALVELDFTMSYTAVLTFTHDYDETVRFVPLTHILSETDSPYVAPAPRRGTRNDPLAVRDVVAAIAGIRGEDEEVVREAILTNANRLFGLKTTA